MKNSARAGVHMAAVFVVIYYRANMAHIRKSPPGSGLDSLVVDSGLVGSTDFHSSHPQG